MNTRRNLQWTEIDTGTGDDAGNIELDLTKDLQEDEQSVKQTTQDSRRPVLTVSKELNKDKENKDNTPGTESEEDQEERAVPRKQARQTEVNNRNDDEDDDDENKGKGGRAHKRIQTLLGRTREKDEVIARLARENEELKKRTRGVERKATETMRDQLKNALENAETELETAMTSNDAAKTAKLTRQIADLTMKYNAYQAVSDEFEEEPEDPPQNVRQQAPAQVPDEAKAWIQRNPWFFKDEKKHVLARMISRDLSSEGEFDPNESEYWEELDKRMSKFGGEAEEKGSKGDESEKNGRDKQPVRQVPNKRNAGPVGSRSEEDSGYSFTDDPQFSRSGNRVTANPTQDDYDMAEKFGLDIKDLMKEKFKYASQGYKGYVPIDVPGQK